MALITRLLKTSAIKSLEDKMLALSLQSPSSAQIREKQTLPQPRLRHPTWFTKKTRVLHNDFVTQENTEFIKEVVEDKYKQHTNGQVIGNIVDWKPEMKRTGVIARKIGEVPLWLKTGKKMRTTMLQVLDNHVIRCYSPEEYDPPRKRLRIKNKNPCLLIGAEAIDPTFLTKEYCGIFKGSGVIPKKYLARFFVSSDAVLPPGTPVSALHYTVGNYIDVRGKTIDRGFQGVMKRHGFKGMPASHGVTKTHRRGGNIGGGGEKGRVWPGTKMPGHMGNRYRIAKGLKIWRMNTKYNVLWVSGPGIPGETNSLVYIYDTNLPLRKPTKPVAFPTYFDSKNLDLGEDIYDENVYNFADPTINFTSE